MVFQPCRVLTGSCEMQKQTNAKEKLKVKFTSPASTMLEILTTTRGKSVRSDLKCSKNENKQVDISTYTHLIISIFFFTVHWPDWSQF